MNFRKGFTLIELMIVVAIIGILALIAIPNFISLRERAYDSSAQSAGHNGKLAQELYVNNQAVGTSYANDLAQLLSFEKNLSDDSEMTFVFGTTNASGYTFTTHHSKSAKTYIWTD